MLVCSNFLDLRVSDVTDCLNQLELTDDGSFPSEDYIIIKDIRGQILSKL